MNAALAEMKRLAHPMQYRPGASSDWYAWFAGTVEQAQQCELLQGVAMPGEPGQPKTVVYVTRGNGHNVRVRRYKDGQVLLRISFTPAEREAAQAVALQREADAKALQAAAAADKAAQEALQKLKEQPATEAAFRKLAKEAFWRQWSVFQLLFLGSHQRHASGFGYSAATVDMLHAFAHSIGWALEIDGTVTLDEAHRYAEVQKARTLACKLDHPLQRFIEQVKGLPMEQEGGAP